jgi:uroporphyrinogen III methyltransferase/synthase
MTNSKKVLLTGVRDSQLSLAQSQQNIAKLDKLLPALSFEIIPMSSPGDRDKITDLRNSEPDFFTRDLDNAVLNGTIDCAIHSAKDLPEQLNSDIDMFYLPWCEDQRDVLVYSLDRPLPPAPIIGVSSERRAQYCTEHFPQGKQLPVRGNIEQRIAQLDAGHFDILVMAAAGLKRLGLKNRISEYISLTVLPVPPAQGWLAITFRKHDSRFNNLRKLFVKRVVLAGAGIGSAANTTTSVISAIKKCDICLYDALCPSELLNNLSPTATAIYVGKRQGEHSLTQPQICQLIIDYARQGKQVVRLKGGDPGIFGRLAEEVELLDEYQLPYTVMPGISSMSLATTSTGLLLTRRGINRGFTVATPRKSGSGKLEWFNDAETADFTKVFFMGASEVTTIAKNMITDGAPKELPISIVYAAGSEQCQIVSGSLDNIAEKLPDTKLPGLIITGQTANAKYLYRQHGALAGQKILFTGSRYLTAKATTEITNFDGSPIIMPMIELVAHDDIIQKLELLNNAQWLIIPSPAAAEILFDAIKVAKFDIRQLPKIAVSGAATAELLGKYGIYPDLVPAANYGSAGLVTALTPILNSNDQVIRLCSDKASPELSRQLSKTGTKILNLEIYRNRVLEYSKLPEFDTVIFTSPSTVAAFIDNFGATPLANKTVSVIGAPTRKQLAALKINCQIIQSSTATLADQVFTLAAEQINRLINLFKTKNPL